MAWKLARIALALSVVASACSDSEKGSVAASGGAGGTVANNGGSVATTGGAASSNGGSAGRVDGGAPSGGSGEAGASVTSQGGANEGGAGGQGGAAGATSVVDASDELYAPENLPRFDIELPESSVTSLNAITNYADPLADEYVPATLRYGSETVADIGLKIKGESSFRKLDKKSAFKLKFDAFVPKQSFHGLRRLTLNNMAEDPSFIAERLAYELFRAAGLPAPRCNSALVYVNGEFFGVYANIEAEDKTFLARWFTSNDGNLYEENSKDLLPGNEASFELETNETKNDKSGLTALIAAAQASTPDDFATTIATKLNLAHFLRFSAAEAAVNQWDMYAYTMFYPNNFRLYDDPDSGRFVFLPWGMDMSMKPFRDSGRPFIPVFGISRQGDRTNGKVTAGRLFRQCLESPSCKAAYTEEVRAIADVYETAQLGQHAAAYKAQIQEHVYADSRKEVSNAAFEAGYQSVLTTIAGRAAALRADLEP